MTDLQCTFQPTISTSSTPLTTILNEHYPNFNYNILNTNSTVTTSTPPFFMQQPTGTGGDCVAGDQYGEFFWTYSWETTFEDGELAGTVLYDEYPMI